MTIMLVSVVLTDEPSIPVFEGTFSSSDVFAYTGQVLSRMHTLGGDSQLIVGQGRVELSVDNLSHETVEGALRDLIGFPVLDHQSW